MDYIFYLKFFDNSVQSKLRSYDNSSGLKIPKLGWKFPLNSLKFYRSILALLSVSDTFSNYCCKDSWGHFPKRSLLCGLIVPSLVFIFNSTYWCGINEFYKHWEIINCVLLISAVKDLLLTSFSLNKVVKLVMQLPSNCLKHSNQIHLSWSSILAVIYCCSRSFSLNIGNNIGDEGAIGLSEALKSNTSLLKLDLSCNGLVASFHSHTIQGIRLIQKEGLDCLKHSN
jgi:hypothetical protein